MVIKFGGTSLGSPRYIKLASNKIRDILKSGKFPVVIVSAMGDTTEHLLGLSKKITENQDQRELDMLLSVGERISMTLLAMALKDKGIKARSFTGSQIGIITDSSHTQAKIKEIRGERLLKAIKDGYVPIVAGFQGVSYEKEVTTLGRGGSDLTAVALTAFLNLREVTIYTDVDGVYSIDPDIIKNSKRIRDISYEEMLEFAQSGAKVIHPRAVSLSANMGIIIRICSFKNSCGGTLVLNKKDIETTKIRGIALDEGNVLYTLKGIPSRTTYFSQVVTRLSEKNIPMKLFFHSIPDHSHIDLSFVVPEEKGKKTYIFLKKIGKELSAKKVIKKEKINLLSLVGFGIGSDIKILQKALKVFEDAKIHIEGILPSEVKITFILSSSLKKITKKLARAFDLEEK